nr:hypothetical protein [Rhodococcus sp. (in: high G+C Gram-positive bacteria)]
MRLPGLAIGFAPWILFLVMPHRLDDGAVLIFSGALSCAVAALLTWWSRGRSGIKMLSASAIPTFAALTAFTAIATDSARTWLGNYAPGAVLFVLAIVMFSTIPSAPFTEQYARESLPDDYWHAPRLHQLNTRVSLLWAITCLVAAASITTAALIATPETGVSVLSMLTLQWLVPVLLALAASRYTAVLTRIDHPAAHT